MVELHRWLLSQETMYGVQLLLTTYQSQLTVAAYIVIHVVQCSHF